MIGLPTGVNKDQIDKSSSLVVFHAFVQESARTLKTALRLMQKQKNGGGRPPLRLSGGTEVT